MTPRPPVRCFVARPGLQGTPECIELVDLSEAAVRCEAGWWVVGPDPADQILLETWLSDATSFLSLNDPGDER